MVGEWSFADLSFDDEPPLRPYADPTQSPKDSDVPRQDQGPCTPEQQLELLRGSEVAAYQAMLKEKSLDPKLANYPPATTEAEVQRLLEAVRRSQAKVWDRGGKVDEAASKGFPGRSRLHVASVPIADEAVYSDVLMLCLEDSVGCGAVWASNWDRLWFRVWTVRLREAAELGKDLLVLTEDDGALGFNQTIEVLYLVERRFAFQVMRAKSFLLQARPLVQAAWYDERERARRLLRGGGAARLLRQTRFDGNGPLNVFAARGAPELVALALEGRADVSQQDFSGFRPLFSASCHGHEDVARVLLAARADVDAARLTGETALFMASAFGHLAVVPLLLETRANVERSRNEGETPVAVACEMGHLATLRLLLAARATVNTRRNDGVTPLFMASLNGHIATLFTLLEARANVHAVTNGGASALSAATQQGHALTLRLLLGARAAMNSPRADGATPLNMASQQGHEVALRLLLNSRASVHQSTDAGETPLHAASRQGHERLVQLLLGARASMRQAMSGGDTPLSVARSEGHEGIVVLLSASGQEPKCCDVQ